jgi:hypothetical protein
LDSSNVSGHVKKITSFFSIIVFNDDYIVFIDHNSPFGSVCLVENCLLYTTKKVIRVVEGEVKQTVPYEQITEVSQESRGLFSFNRVTVLCDEKTIKLSVWNRDVSVWTVKLLEGFIAQNLQRSKEQKVEEDNVPFNTADEAPPDGLPTPDLNRQYSEKTALRHRLAAAEEEIEDGKQCRICLDHQMDCILTPCAHLVCCTTCAASLNDKDCPVCRTIVSGNTKIFWA